MPDLINAEDASSICVAHGGSPVWFTDAAELNWLRSIMEDFGIACVYIGKI